MVSRIIGASALSFFLTATTGFAQSALNVAPAEQPPADFSGNQYVDSNGCAFIRAGVSGITTWVPRVNRRRELLCGFQPTFTSAQAEPTDPIEQTAETDAPVISPLAPQTPQAPEMADTDAAAAEPADAKADNAAAPVVTAPPVVTATNVPPATAPTIPTAPAPTPVPVRSPAVISLPPVTAPAPVVAPVPAIVPRRITFAEACAGRVGIQPGMIGSRTGNPIDCGPATAPIVAPGMAQSAGLRQVTRAEICAEIAAHGRTIIDYNTGAPVNCAPVSQTVAANTLGSLLGTRIPASNPTAATAADTPPAPGYSPVWNDGRLNPDRGVPTANSTQPIRVAAPVTAPASVPSPVPVATTGHRYVQVGTFGVAANADRTTARLQAMGLPVGHATVRRNGQALRVIAAGPFSNTAELQNALQAARSIGFSDAFTRR